MSLINDALKRAGHVQKKAAPPMPAPMRPVEPARRSPPHLGILLALGLVCLVGLGGLFIWFGLMSGGRRLSAASVVEVRAAPPATEATDPLSVSATIKTAPAAVQAAPAMTVATVSAAAPALAPASTDAGSSLPASEPPAPVAAAAPTVTPVVKLPPPPPLPKLQGIFYRPDRPAALLDGRTAFIGGLAGEYRVVGINQQSVTLVRAGQTNVLTMPN